MDTKHITKNLNHAMGPETSNHQVIQEPSVVKWKSYIGTDKT